MLRVVPGHVVARQFLEGVERHKIIDVHGDAARPEALDDPLEFLLVFGVDPRPEHLAGGLAEELPIALRVVRVDQLDRLKRVGDLGREQIAVLEPDASGRSFEVDVNPPAAFKAVRASETRVGRTRLRLARRIRGETSHVG